MCGRFALCDQIEVIDEAFGVVAPIWLTPRYNIAPGTSITCLSYQQQQTIIEPMQWGMVPHWAKTKSQLIINAREETADSKPMFKKLLQAQRCCILASGYYEWHRDEQGNKQPYYIFAADKKPFAMAGLWQYAMREDGVKIKQCAILTTEAHKELAEIHHRMPVILNAEQSQVWLQDSAEVAIQLAHRNLTSQLSYYAVSDYVNSAKHDLSKCIKPLE